MAAYIFADNAYKLLAGNKIVHNGNMLSMKDTDKIIIDGKAYYLGDYNTLSFPNIYDGFYYIIGRYAYSNDANSRYQNLNFTEVTLDTSVSGVGLSNGAIYRLVSISVTAEPITPSDKNYQSLSGYPYSYTDTGEIYYVTASSHNRAGGVGKKIKSLVTVRYQRSVSSVYVICYRAFYITEDDELYIQDGYFDADNADEFVFNYPTKITDNCTYISASHYDYNYYEPYDTKKLVIVNHKLYVYRFSYDDLVLYDDSGNWSWASRVYSSSDSYGNPYGVKDGMLMYLDPSYPTIIDNRTGWTSVSAEYNISGIAYGICDGNLYKLGTETVTEVSDTGDWVEVWGHYRDDSVHYAFAAKSNGHLFRIEDTTLTDLGSVSGGAI